MGEPNENQHEIRAVAPTVSSITVHRQSLQAGAFEFIPLPFVDDWLIRRERRSLVEKVLNKRGLRYEKKVPQLLADGGAKTFLGRLGGLARSLVLKPLRKILRAFFFWLTIRRAVLTMVETYFLARFANLAELDQGSPITEDQAKRWGKLFAETVSKIDRRIAREGIRKLWKWMAENKRNQKDNLSREEVEKQPENEVPGVLGDFDRRISEGLAKMVEK